MFGMAISVTHFSDPGCPWAYSASPALAALYWRYGDQLEWRLATIGLTEQADQYVQRGYTPARGRGRRGAARPRRFCVSRPRGPNPFLAGAARAHGGDEPRVPCDRRDPP